MLGDVNELVVRYVDHEMVDEEMRAFEAMLDARPELQSLVAEHKALRATLTQAWGEVPDEAHLARIHLLLEAPSHKEGQSLRSTQRLPQRFPGARRFWPLPAIAASLLMGVIIGKMDFYSPSASFLHEEDGQLFAAGMLDTALNRQLTSQTEGAPVTIRLSFRTREGMCRTFLTAGGTAGLACRQSGRWQVQSTMQGETTGRRSEYRLAASAIPSPIMAQVDGMILGEPLSQDDERREIAQGW